MDGTITLTEPLHYQAFNAVFKKHGVGDFTYEEEITKYAGSGSKNIFTKVFADRGVKVSPEEIEKCMAEKKKLYTNIVQDAKVSVVPGITKFLEKTETLGLKRIIATGQSDLTAVRFILEKVGLLNFFPNIVSITEVAHGKPAPDVFIEAAKRLGFPREKCVIFEDAINGVTAAHAAEIRCIALETTTKREDLLAAGASIVVKNYSEITNEILYGN